MVCLCFGAVISQSTRLCTVTDQHVQGRRRMVRRQWLSGGGKNWHARIWPKPHLANKNPNLAGHFRDRIWPNRIWPKLVFLVFWTSVCVQDFEKTLQNGREKKNAKFWAPPHPSGPPPLRAPGPRPQPSGPPTPSGPQPEKIGQMRSNKIGQIRPN